MKIISFAIFIILPVQGAFWSSPEPPKPAPDDPTNYGVDVTTPIHHMLDKNTYFGKKYFEMMEGCYKKFSRRECEGTERARIEMNFDQPRTQHNYTDIGFKHIKAPDSIYKPIMEFYKKHRDLEVAEEWPRGNTYTNNWDVPTTMISFENKNLRGSGFHLKDEIWAAAKPILEEWTNQRVIPTSLYGIRIYHNNSVLATHVDRLPLVSSAILNVDQDLDEPWPIEVYGRDGRAYNVTMMPGDMVLYESHTTLHGRPFPMRGRFFANVFIHFAPIDHDLNNEKDQQLKANIAQQPPTSHTFKEAKQELKILSEARDRIRSAGHEQDNHPTRDMERHMDAAEQLLHAKHASGIRDFDKLREKILRGEDPEDEDEGSEEEGEELIELEPQEDPAGRTDLHVAAALGSRDRCEKILGKHSTDLLHARDENGWQAVHEAARGGHLDTLEFLVEMGADISAETSDGHTVLWWARQSLPENHEVIDYLLNLGAPE